MARRRRRRTTYSYGSYNDLPQFGGEGITNQPIRLIPKYRLPDWYERPLCIVCGTPMLAGEARETEKTGIVPETHTSSRPRP